MAFFNFNKKEKERLKREQEFSRLEQEKERERINRETEELLYDILKKYKRKQQEKRNNYNNYEQYDYEHIIDDEIFQEFFKQTYYNNYESNYNKQRQEYSLYNQNIALDNAFKLMKLNKTDNEIVIKKRYRELSLKWHPDKWSTNTIENQSIANRNFIKLNNAYNIIKKYKNIK